MSKKLSVLISLVTLLSVLSSAQAEPTDPGTKGLVAAYTFDTGFFDVTGGGYDGFPLGGPLVQAGVLNMDGIDDVIIIPRIGGAAATFSQCSLLMKLKPAVDPATLEFAGGLNTIGSADGSIQFRLNNGKASVSLKAPGVTDLVGTTVAAVDVWTCIAVTVSETEVCLYVNGVKEASEAVAAPLNLILGNAFLGGWAESLANPVGGKLAGQVDDVLVYTKALSADEVAYMAGLRSEDPIDPGAQGLVAYYALNGDANDSSANQLNGDIVTVGDVNSTATFVDGPAGYGKAIDLLPTGTGTKGSYVNCGADPNFDFVDAMTVGAWINVRSIPDEWRAIVCKGDNAWRISLNGAKTSVQYSIAGYGTRPAFSIDGTTEVGFNSWHYVCGTYNTSVGARLYIDGVLEGTLNDLTGISKNTNNVTIGANEGDTGWKPYRLFDGQIDEVSIYNRALSANEVRFLGGERAKPVNPGAEGLVASYAFNNDANDSSGNGLNGAIVTVGDVNSTLTFVDGAMGYGKAIDLLPTATGTKGSYVNCGADAQFDFVDAMTVGAWINVRSIPDEWRAIVCKGDNAWRISLNGAKTSVQYSIAGYGTRPAFSIDGTTEVGFNSWHYVCGTYNTVAGAALYVDGVLEGTLADLTGISKNTNNVTIGANEGDTGWKPYRLFDGQIDEVSIYSRSLTEGEVRYLAGFRPEPTSEGLVAYYAFDNDANDSSGSGLNGDIVTVGDVNSTLTFVDGAMGYGKAIDLLPTGTGTKGSYVNCGADPNFDFVDAMTVGAWINVRSIPDEWRAIVCKGDNAWRISLNGAKTSVQYSIAGYGTRPAFSIDGTTEVGFNSWHYVCGTYDKSVGAALYVDGALEGTLADLTGISLNTNNVTIGANEGDTGWKPYRLFDGQIDEVRIYNRALSENEVKALSGN